MAVTAALRKDHDILRTTLECLEAALRVAPEQPLVLRDICCQAFTRVLDRHIKREEAALKPYRHRVQRILRQRERQDHADQRRVLRDLNALLLQGVTVPAGTIAPRFFHLIDELREHMAEEEREIFPTVDRVEAEQPSRASSSVPLITEGMSANAVMAQCPSTKPVFEKYGIRCGCDGCDDLDELAWRRGMETAELVSELQQAATTAGLPAMDAPDAVLA